MYMFMALPPIGRLCPIRLFLPTTEHDSPTPEWSDVGFAYLRELHKFDKENPGVLPNVLCLATGRAMVDFHPDSRWSPYAGWFFGRCPIPGRTFVTSGGTARFTAPTLVNLVIGAGDTIDTYYTPGTVNILVTGHGIPPHKISWMTNTAWKYDSILTMSAKHSQVIDDLREKERALATERVRIAEEANTGAEMDDLAVAGSPSKMTIVVPPNAANIGQLVATLKTALEACVPESEKTYG